MALIRGTTAGESSNLTIERALKLESGGRAGGLRPQMEGYRSGGAGGGSRFPNKVP